MSLDIGETLFNAVAEFLEFVEVCDERVDFLMNVARFIDLFINRAIRIYDSNGR